DPYLAVPLVLLSPPDAKPRPPVVVAVAQGGKKGFLEHRAEAIVRLLDAGVSVCLPDLRGTGEMRTTGEARGRTSSDTSVSAGEWMHGNTVLGTQLQELLLVMESVGGPCALWGDSFGPMNEFNAKLAV